MKYHHTFSEYAPKQEWPEEKDIHNMISKWISEVIKWEVLIDIVHEWMLISPKTWKDMRTLCDAFGIGQRN